MSASLVVDRTAAVARAGSPALRSVRLLLVAAFAGALVVRLMGVADSPLIFHPTRQFLGLRVAQAEYLAGRPGVPAAVRTAVQLNARAAPQLEPRFLETAVVAGYRLFGGERVWLGGTISSLLWVLLGGTCLFLIARRLASDLAAAVAVGFYLFLPYAISASRTFQPDPAMVAFMLAALLAIVRHHDKPTIARLVSAAALSATAILIKPTVVFVTVGAMAALAVDRGGFRRGLLQRQTLALFVLTVLPATVFYVQGIVAGTATASNAGTSFIPELFGQAAYWKGWLEKTNEAVGTVFVLAAALSLVVARKTEARRVIGGLLAGYLVYGLVFNYHIHTHDYYSLQLIPIVALGLGLVSDAAICRVHRMELGRPVRIVGTVAVVFLGVSVLYRDLKFALLRAEPSPATVAAQSRTIGELVSHSTRTVMLAPAYGWPLGYYGSISGSSWPSAAEGDFRALRLLGKEVPSPRQLLDRTIRAGAEWFIVTNMDELHRQPALKPLLDSRARLAGSGDGFLIYDLRRRG